MRVIFYIVLVFTLFVAVSGSYAQETRVSATLKLHPWLNLPVVESIDIKGGLKNFGSMNLGDSPAAALNLAIHELKREIGMIASVTESVSNKKRYFEYIGTGNWLEVFVINSWEPNHNYTQGDYVAYQGDYYVAKTIAFTSAATFEADNANWNNAGGKSGKYFATELKMDNQVLSKVATSASTVQEADKDNTIATVGFVNSSGGSFDAKKAITRAGLSGITGTNFQSTNIVDFLNKLFFPVLGPKIKSFKYNNNSEAGKFSSQIEDPATKVITDNKGHINIEFGDWNGLTELTFNYDIETRDATIPITKVELLKDGVSIADAVTNGSPTGTLTLKKSISHNFTNVDITQDIPVTLKVTDNSSNEVSLVLNTSFLKADGVTLDNVRISSSNTGPALTTAEGSGISGDPYLIERTGSDLKYYFVWTINGKDDAGHVTDIDFSGTPALTDLHQNNITDTYIDVQFPYSENNRTDVYRVGARAMGSIANDWSTVSNSSYYQLQDRLYCGFLASDVKPSVDNIIHLQKSSLKTTDYYSDSTTNPNTNYTNNTGSSGFFTWAVPTYYDGTSLEPTSFAKDAWYYSLGSWKNNNTNTNTYYVQVTEGGTSSWYWICIYKASLANGESIRAKLSNKTE